MENKSSLERFKNLVNDAISLREIMKSSTYKVKISEERKKGKVKKEKLSIFHEGKSFFEYNLTDNKIIGFKYINRYTRSNINNICKILKLSGEFKIDYHRIGYDLVYHVNGKFYDEKMNVINYNLDNILKDHIRKIKKQRYDTIRKLMSNGKIELDEIPYHKTWLKKRNGKWFAYSELARNLYFPVSAKEVFNIISAGLTTPPTTRIYIKTQIYKIKYNDYIKNKIDSGKLKEWEIDLKNRYSDYSFKLIKIENEENKLNIKIENEIEDGEQWLLKSDGEISFDKRTMTRFQVKEFIRYILSIDDSQDSIFSERTIPAKIPDIIKNTPLNLSINENKKINPRILELLKIIGNEIRIYNRNLENRNEYVATSINGKECIVSDGDMNALLKSGFYHKVLQKFEEKLLVERSIERMALMKKIMPAFNPRYPIILNEVGKKLIIFNSDGEFHISMVDASLKKIIRNDDYIYICVRPIEENIRPSIIIDGEVYDIDLTMDEILSKAIMLIEEKYPDVSTVRQIRFKK
jgi:hypothetical protein